MRDKKFRILSKVKELANRINICKTSHGYSDEDVDYIKRKSDIPHSLGSNYFNGYETKSRKNKQERLKQRKEIKSELYKE